MLSSPSYQTYGIELVTSELDLRDHHSHNRTLMQIRIQKMNHILRRIHRHNRLRLLRFYILGMQHREQLVNQLRIQ